MDRVVLPNGRVTSRIGFGCAQLRGGSYTETSRVLVRAALDAGISHFDLAPSYALGMAENVAGGILGSLRDEVTITTKVGIARPRAPGMLTAIRRAAKPLLAGYPALWTMIAGKVRRAASDRQRFAPESVLASVEDSLRRLQVDAVDILLMHEMAIGDLTDQLMVVLDGLKRSGRVGTLGTGGDRAEGRLISSRSGALGEVRQFGWNVFEPDIEEAAGSFCITHGAIGNALQRTARLLRENPQHVAAWSDILGLDLADQGTLGDLLLGAALAQNRNGIVLVASQNPIHIRRAAAVASDHDLIARAGRLGALLREEALSGIRQEALEHSLAFGGGAGR